MSDAGNVDLFEKRIEIYPRSVKGPFRRLKWGILTLAYGVYFLLPWLRWERLVGPEQAVSFDIHGRRFYLFDLVVHAQDIFWLAGILMIAAMLLFFVTGLAGRVFCGYFCFQTLWTDVFVLIEHLVQGERPARIRLDKAPWSGEKIAKKAMTHGLWLLTAFVTGLTFTLYWGDAPQLVEQFFTAEAPFPAYATTLFLTATTYVMAGLAREQVCTYMCPYARFQGVMFDRDTLIVAYDEQRGEGDTGRYKIRRGYKTREERTAQGAGDCIDCGYCVQVCPTGIDIRNGLQYQCISCALCIDACNNIMDTMGWPQNLIGYTSEKQQQGGTTKLIKPKTIGYGAAILTAIGFLVASVVNQASLEMAVSQVRQPLYVMMSDGRIQNSYEIKINNKTNQLVRLHLELLDLPGAELDLGKVERIQLRPDQSLRLMARVRYLPVSGDGAPHTFRFQVEPAQDSVVETVSQPALFYVPGSER